MKKLCLLLLLNFLSFSLFAGPNAVNQIRVGPNEHITQNYSTGPAEVPLTPGQRLALMHKYQDSFVANDYLRFINGKTNFVCKTLGSQFEGTVVAVSSNRVWLQGWFAEPLFYVYEPAPRQQRFLLINFPHPVRIGQSLSRTERWVAFPVSENVRRNLMKSPTGEIGPFPCLDYGTVVVIPKKIAPVAIATSVSDSTSVTNSPSVSP